MSGASYIFDTELTDRENGEIIEAAWLRIESVTDLFGEHLDDIPSPLPICEQFQQRYKPVKQTTFGALAVHHILPSELEHCRPSSEFALPADTEYLIGHSIDTDWTAAGAPAHIKRIDTCVMAKWIWQDADGYSQSALLYRLLGPLPETRERLLFAHSALVDVQNNLRLLEFILEAKPEIRAWAALHAFSEECRIPRTCPFKRWDGMLLEDMDDGAIGWCLRQDFIDPYFRIGLERVIERRRAAYRESWAAGRSADSTF